MPSYTLCPDIRIAGIGVEIGVATTVAADIIDGPIALTGHSAGGQLVARQVCASSTLSQQVLCRIDQVVPISALSGLPLAR